MHFLAHTDLIYLTADTDTAIQIQIQRYRSESRTRAAFYAQMQQVARRRTNTFAHHIQYVKTAIDKGTNNSRGYSQPDVCVLVCIGRCVWVCGFNVAGLSVVIEFRVLNR